MEERPSPGSQPESIIAFQDLRFTRVCHVCLSFRGIEFSHFLKISLAHKFLQMLNFRLGRTESGCGQRHSFIFYIMTADSSFVLESLLMARDYCVLWYCGAHWCSADTRTWGCATVDWEIFALGNFSVLNFHTFYFCHLDKCRKIFMVYT